MSKWFDKDFQHAIRTAMERYAHRDPRSPMRWGQTLYNSFHDVRPELVCQVVMTERDPFHSDANISRFLDFLEKNW